MLFLLPWRQISKFFFRRSCEIYCTVATLPLLYSGYITITRCHSPDHFLVVIIRKQSKQANGCIEMLTNVDGDFIKMYVHTSQIRSSSLLHPCYMYPCVLYATLQNSKLKCRVVLIHSWRPWYGLSTTGNLSTVLALYFWKKSQWKLRFSTLHISEH